MSFLGDVQAKSSEHTPEEGPPCKQETKASLPNTLVAIEAIGM